MRPDSGKMSDPETPFPLTDLAPVQHGRKSKKIIFRLLTLDARLECFWGRKVFGLARPFVAEIIPDRY